MNIYMARACFCWYGYHTSAMVQNVQTHFLLRENCHAHMHADVIIGGTESRNE